MPFDLLSFQAMSFTIRLEADQLAVEAGVSTPLSIEVANRADAQDQFELLVEGLDPEWTAVPVPIFTVDAHDVTLEKVFFKPARTSESLAGNYPFVVKVRSLTTGETRTSPAVLEIHAYNHVTMEVLPKKGVISWVKKQNVFNATLMNLGNNELTMQMFGSDPEDALVYDFSQEQVTVGPGQQKIADVSVVPQASRPFASMRLHGFTLSARAVDASGVAASAQAQLEQRPFMSPGTLFLTLLALMLFAGWIALMPKPPQVDSFTLDRGQVLVGEQVQASWKTSHSKSVKLSFNGQVLLQRGNTTGNFSFVAKESGTLELVAYSENQSSAPMTSSLEVTAPPVVPAAEIESFSISPRTIGAGKTLVISYRLKNATRATLLPTNTVLDPNIQQLEIPGPEEAGTKEYYIIAYNAKDEPVQSRRVSVRVVEESDASVVVFRAEPNPVDLALAKVTLTWQVANGARTELYANGERLFTWSETSGEEILDIYKTTEYTLVVYDQRGRPVRQKLTVKVTEPPPPTTTGDGSSGTTGTTGATTTATTGTTGSPTTTTTGGR